MQIRSVGSVPMVQAQQQSVDYIGPRVAAQGAGQLAQVLDRMSASAFQMAGTLRQQEALQYVASNPPSAQQLDAAKNGVTIGLGGRGETSSISSTGSLNIFDQAVAKARSLELSGHFEMEGRNELVKMLSGVEDGSVTAEQVSTKIKTMSDGYSKSLSSIDPEASIKFRATMATHGNTVLNAAYKSELERAKDQRIGKFNLDFNNSIRLLEQTISDGSWTDASGQERSIDELADLFRKNVLNQSLLIGGKSLQKEHEIKFEAALKDAKINAVTKVLMSEENMADPELTKAKIKAGDIGKMSPVLRSLILNDFESVLKIEANFKTAVDSRKQGIEFNLAAAQRKGDVLLRQIYSSKSPAEQNALFSQLTVLPVSPENIKTARAFITDQAKEGRANDDFTALGLVSRRVALGLATQSEINNGPFTNSTKRELTRALANPTDDINYATKQISLAVGIQSANLPPELKSAEARQVAVQTSNDLSVQLYRFVSTPNEKGVLPTPGEVRQRGDELAKQAKSQMSGAFGKVAESNQKSAVLQLPELNGVDLTNKAAVDAAFAAATKRKANPTSINAARSSVDDYLTNTSKAQEGKAK
jgi:hypothetical protein